MWINYLDQALLLAALAVSVNLLVGYAGQVSVAHAAFAGVGGYTVCLLATSTTGRTSPRSASPCLSRPRSAS